MKPVLWTLFILLFCLALILVFFLAGGYNVAATEPHGGLMDWFLVKVRDNSIRTRAAKLVAPNLERPDRVASGLAHFHEMCVGCHGAPGVEPSAAGKGLYPPPPDLAHAARELSAPELFWVTKYGIKMTGMPAYGPTHDDESLWDIVAFLQVLPDLTPEQYQAMLAEQGIALEKGHGGHNHGHVSSDPVLAETPAGTSPQREAESEHEHQHAVPHPH